MNLSESASSEEGGGRPNPLLMSGNWGVDGEMVEEGEELPRAALVNSREAQRRQGESEFYALSSKLPPRPSAVVIQDEEESSVPSELARQRKERDKRHRRLKRQLKNASAECAEWLKTDEGWTPVPFDDKHPTIHLFEKQMEGGCYLLKARGPVKYWDPFDFARTQMDTNHITRMKWDQDLEDIKIVETIGQAAELQQVPLDSPSVMPDKLSVIWYRTKTPTMAKLLNVWDRDFCCIQYWSLKRDGSILIVGQSTEHARYPSDKANEYSCVRGETTCTMLIKKREKSDPKDPEEPTLFVEMAAWVKPNGWVPEKVIAWFKHRMAERILFFSNECWNNATTKGLSYY